MSGSLATYLLCVTALVSASQITATTKTMLLDQEHVTGSSYSMFNTETDIATDNGLYYSTIGLYPHYDSGPHPHHDSGPHLYHDFGPHPYYDSGPRPNYTPPVMIKREQYYHKPRPHHFHTMTTTKSHPFHIAAKARPHLFCTASIPRVTKSAQFPPLIMNTSSNDSNINLQQNQTIVTDLRDTIIYCRQWLNGSFNHAGLLMGTNC